MARQQTQKTHEEHIAEIWKMFKESRQELKESRQKFDREFEKSKQEADQQTRELKQQMKETAQQIKETDKQLKKFIGGTGNRWGALGENLVEGNLVKRLREKGIEVERVLTRMKVPNKAEFDIIAVNGKEIVVVEVKSTLDVLDVDEFLEKLKHFKKWCSEYKDKIVYGAVAFLLNVNDQADAKAEKAGLFVIKATGDVVIENKENFKPKSFQ